MQDRPPPTSSSVAPLNPVAVARPDSDGIAAYLSPHHSSSSSATAITPLPPAVTSGPAVEAEEELDSAEGKQLEVLDVEHMVVHDDPREWPRSKKTIVLAIIAFTAIGATISANIYFPAIESLQADLNASSGLLSATVSLFILGQGVFPMLWSGLSEIKGRKSSYLASLVLYCIGTAVCSRANSIGLFLGMRVLQSLGSSAVLALGAGTLADIYDVHERGTKLGIYYGVPLLGPSIGPLIGGALTSRSSWRSTFYFLLGYGVLCLGLLLYLPETFRKERSLAWRLAMTRARHHAKQDLIKARAVLPDLEKADTPAKSPCKDPPTSHLDEDPSSPPAMVQSQHQPAFSSLGRIITALSTRSAEDTVKPRLRDINPFAAIGAVLRQRHNFLAIFFSGLLFASQYSINYTASRTFAAAPYNYGPIDVGLILFAFGCGNIIGSLGGGKYSDRMFNKLKQLNGGVGEAEMRIKSTFIAMAIMPPCFIIYAWVVQKEVPVYWPVITLFFLGIASIWIYASTLAYVVDANPGRSSSAVSCNSLFRGVLAAAASQASEPLIADIGNGWYYTGFAVLLVCGELALVVVSFKGKAWRQAYQQAEREAHGTRSKSAPGELENANVSGLRP